MRKWKQRLFSLLLCGAILFSLCPPAAAAEESGTFTNGSWTLDDSGTLTITCTAAENVPMPDFKLGDSPWDSLGESIKSVVFSNGGGGSFTSIGPSAFWQCTSLGSINLPDTLESIGAYAFQLCTGLTTIALPDTLKSIEGCAFQNCTSLTAIDLPEGLTSIGMAAFSNCTNLTTVTFTGDPPTLGEGVFESCGKLKTIEVPAGKENAYHDLLKDEYPDLAPEKEPETYLAWDGSKLVSKPVPEPITEVTADIKAWNSSTTNGWYIVRGGVFISSRVTVTGNVYLILANGCNLTADAGINVGEGNSLTIYAQSTDGSVMGKLTATGSSDAGIGGTGGAGGAGGTITINGGTVTANGNGGSAGIGGGSGNGYDGTGGSGYTGGNGGTIAITGGEVTADGKWGADIGGGADGRGFIAQSDKIEIGDANVKGPNGSDPIIGTAEHKAKDEWASDSTNHWHPCKKEGCPDRFGQKAHDFSDWTTDTEPTDTTPGSKSRDCTTCGYHQTETIPPIEPPDPVDPEPPKPVDPPSGGDSYIPPTYRPDVTQPGEGGTVSVTPSRPERGDTVTIKPKPDEGYEVDKITVTDKNGKPIEVAVKPDGTYTFKQPTGKVKIEVIYKPIETPWSNPFADVPEGAWYYEAVRFVQEQGLMSGYSDGRFAPEDTLSRSQLAQILFNKEGRPGANYLLDFSDVAGEAWYTEAIRWAASQGIVSGYSDGTFGPNAPITREQLAVMLWRYSGSPVVTGKELHFNDEAEISGFALDAIRWAVENGILNGYGGQLAPQGQATRAQAAQMLKNFIENQETNT